jgi:outer membrane protein assembly factor BamD (BamD/ComL family)
MLGVTYECYRSAKGVREEAATRRAAQMFRHYPRNIELPQAFSRIESAFLRGAIIKTAREAASITPTEPPKSTA